MSGAFTVDASVFVSAFTPSEQEAAELAARHRLRGSEAVYTAVARRFAAALITLNAEQEEHNEPDCPNRSIQSDGSAQDRA